MNPGLVTASVRALGQVFGARQLRSGCQAELGEHLVQVVFDGAPTQEQLAGDLRVGGSTGSELSDLQLLYGELVQSDRARRRCLASRAKLGAGTLCPRRRTELLESRQGCAQMDPRRRPHTGTAQCRAVDQLGAGAFVRTVSVIMQREGGEVTV